MMNPTELRTEFHHLIDNFTSMEALEELYEIAQQRMRYEKKEISLKEELTAEQYNELQEAREQVKQGKTIPHNEAMARIKTWVTK